MKYHFTDDEYADVQAILAHAAQRAEIDDLDLDQLVDPPTKPTEWTFPVAVNDDETMEVSVLQIWSRLAPLRVNGVPTVVPIIISENGTLALDWPNSRTVGDK